MILNHEIMLTVVCVLIYHSLFTGVFN